MKENTLRDEEYEAALAELEKLITSDPAPGTPAYDRMDLLALVIQNYEDKAYPMDPPDPVEAIKFRMEQAGLTRKDK